jgi:hypothetical protein
MAWKKEIVSIVRVLINDLNQPYSFSDSRLQQAIVVAAQFVKADLTFNQDYLVNITSPDISPDPTELEQKDDIFINCVSLKTSCIIDQSIFRTKATLEGIKTALGPAQLSVAGNLAGFKILLDQGPCALYTKFIEDYEIANATNIAAVLGPFIGNKFDPRLTNANLGSFYRHNEGFNGFFS